MGVGETSDHIPRKRMVYLIGRSECRMWNECPQRRHQTREKAINDFSFFSSHCVVLSEHNMDGPTIIDFQQNGPVSFDVQQDQDEDQDEGMMEAEEDPDIIDGNPWWWNLTVFHDRVKTFMPDNSEISRSC